MLVRTTAEDGRSVEATPEHLFWAEGKGFVAARRLAAQCSRTVMEPIKTSRKQAVTGHYIVHWGVPRGIQEREEAPFDLAILRFGSRTPGGGVRYATNGMSSFVQTTTAASGFRAELYASAGAECPWAIDLLAALTVYPMQVGECLCEYQTVPVGHPLDRNHSPFEHLLISPPSAQEGDGFGGIVNLDPEPILVYQVVGITDSEYQFALKHDRKMLWQRLGGETLTREIDAAGDTH